MFKLPNLPALPGQDPPSRSVALLPIELGMLLDGIDLSSVKRSKRYRRTASMK